jgi:drug/metabolite transporter (DMT)-like permease
MNKTKVGIGLAAATAVISGFSIFLNGYAVRELPDAGVFTALKNSAAALVLFAVALPVLRSRGKGFRVDRRGTLGLTLVAIVGGSVPFLLFFTGLSMASAPSAAFIHKTLFIWVALLAVPFLGERLGLLQIGALGALLASQLLIVPPNGVVWGVGETMITAATLLWSVEVILAKRLMSRIDPLVVGVGRLGLGLVVLFGYLALTGKLSLIAGLGASQWIWVLLTGVLLAGYVGTWFSALRLAPATVVTSVLVLAAPITATLDVVVNGKVLAPAPLTGYVLIFGAAAVLALTTLRSRQSQPAGTVA